MKTWEILVAGPAGYVRYEMFWGEDLEAALEVVSQQNFATVSDEDGNLIAKEVTE